MARRPLRRGGSNLESQEQLLPERRIISILAVDVARSTRHIAQCDPDDAQVFFDRCFDHVRSRIEAAGGTLVSYEGDGGIATFGWPNAVEDHADCACVAACSIQQDNTLGTGPDGRKVKFRIGVHAGLVAVRQLRGEGRSRLDTVGAAVHIAAKLQQAAAPGFILISADAVRMCHVKPKLGQESQLATFDGTEVEAWPLEGPAEPFSRAGFTARYQSPMIGRRAEVARLVNLLPRIGGASTSIAVIGEPGIGKSRLAAELVSNAMAADRRVFIIFGDAQKRSAAFAAVRDLFAGGALPDVEERARHHELLGAAGFEPSEIETLEVFLGRARRTAGDRSPRLTETQLARLFVSAFINLMLDQPSLILIEDLHLLDPESQHFLQILRTSETPQPILLLVTGRPESLTVAREICSSILVLEPLPKSAMRALAQLLWHRERPPSDAVLDRLLGRADGVPLLLEELVLSTLSGSTGASPLPQTFGSLIHARLSGLSPGARRLAQAISLLGEYVELEFGSEVLAVDTKEVRRRLDELERFALVHPLEAGRMHIRHQVIAEACLETIPHAQRRELHEAAYRVIATPTRSARARDEQLAYHAEGAGKLALALEHLWSAALEARRSSASASLSLIFDRAIALIGQIGEAAEDRYVDFVLMAFASLIQRGEFEKMNEHLPRVIEFVRQSGRSERISSALSQLGMICWFEGRYEEGLRATEEGLALARLLKSPALFYANMIMQTNLRHCLGQVNQAIAEQSELCGLLTGELETARLGSPGMPSATALSFMSWFLLEVGDYAEGLKYVERGLEIAIREKDLYAEVLARNGLGRNLTALDRNEDAVACLEIARKIADHNGYDAIKAELDGRAAIALARCGRGSEALEIVEACLRAGMHLRTGQLEFYYLLAGKAEALFQLGQHALAFSTLSDAETIARRVNNPCLIVDALGLHALYLECRDPVDPRIAEVLAERAAICARFGLVAWNATKSVN